MNVRILHVKIKEPVSTVTAPTLVTVQTVGRGITVKKMLMNVEWTLVRTMGRASIHRVHMAVLARSGGLGIFVIRM